MLNQYLLIFTIFFIQLSHYLDTVEVQIGEQISMRSEAFFHAMTSHDELQDYMQVTCRAIKQLRWVKFYILFNDCHKKMNCSMFQITKLSNYPHIQYIKCNILCVCVQHVREHRYYIVNQGISTGKQFFDPKSWLLHSDLIFKQPSHPRDIGFDTCSF